MDFIHSWRVVTKCHLCHSSGGYLTAMEIKRVILTIETIETTTITISQQGVTPDEKSSRFVFVAVQHDRWRGVWGPESVGDQEVNSGPEASSQTRRR
jgi:hypothetical protein